MSKEFLRLGYMSNIPYNRSQSDFHYHDGGCYLSLYCCQFQNYGTKMKEKKKFQLELGLRCLERCIFVEVLEVE
jgi:hypothetical protein